MITFGSVCSGIDAASVALNPLGFQAIWFSEIDKAPIKVLEKHYPKTQNLGDMKQIPKKILEKEIQIPNILFGGTPCQAFSLAGHRNSLDDERGSLTLAFVDIVKAMDTITSQSQKPKSTIVWENVEGVLSDSQNAFGCFLAGLLNEQEPKRPSQFNYKWKTWGDNGFFKNEHREVAWRILDAKYFGLPQQRKRVFVVSTDRKYSASEILGLGENMKQGCGSLYESYKGVDLEFEKDGHSFIAFRDYTDCLYSAYGTKWNGNSASVNGSLFVVQNDRLRRLSPSECERLMGLPTNYTLANGVSDTNRYKMLGNSWAVPVIKWLGYRLIRVLFIKYLWNIDSNIMNIGNKATIQDIVEIDCDEKFYISQKAKNGMLSRDKRYHRKTNSKLLKYITT